MATAPVMSLTQNAIDQVKQLMFLADDNSFIGIRIGVRSGGCSGYKYFIEYAKESNKYDEVIPCGDEGIKVLIDPKALMYLIGTTMDYIQDDFKSGFVFTNPNERSKCGCGSSFSV